MCPQIKHVRFFEICASKRWYILNKWCVMMVNLPFCWSQGHSSKLFSSSNQCEAQMPSSNLLWPFFLTMWHCYHHTRSRQRALGSHLETLPCLPSSLHILCQVLLYSIIETAESKVQIYGTQNLSFGDFIIEDKVFDNFLFLQDGEYCGGWEIL